MVIGVLNQYRKNKQHNGSRCKNYHQGGNHFYHYLFQGDNLPDTKKSHSSKQYYQKNKKIRSNFLHKIHGIRFKVPIELTKVRIIYETINRFWFTLNSRWLFLKNSFQMSSLPSVLSWQKLGVYFSNPAYQLKD